jgi:hypothetical protein
VHAVVGIKMTLEENHVATCARNKSKAFTDYHHGVSLAQQMHRLCSVTDDTDLPEVQPERKATNS